MDKFVITKCAVYMNINLLQGYNTVCLDNLTNAWESKLVEPEDVWSSSFGNEMDCNFEDNIYF